MAFEIEHRHGVVRATRRSPTRPCTAAGSASALGKPGEVTLVAVGRRRPRDAPLGWAWLSSRTNSLTGARYGNFRSLAVADVPGRAADRRAAAGRRAGGRRRGRDDPAHRQGARRQPGHAGAVPEVRLHRHAPDHGTAPPGRSGPGSRPDRDQVRGLGHRQHAAGRDLPGVRRAAARARPGAGRGRPRAGPPRHRARPGQQEPARGGRLRGPGDRPAVRRRRVRLGPQVRGRSGGSSTTWAWPPTRWRSWTTT